jgi:hypothetical protein
MEASVLQAFCKSLRVWSPVEVGAVRCDAGDGCVAVHGEASDYLIEHDPKGAGWHVYHVQSERVIARGSTADDAARDALKQHLEAVEACWREAQVRQGECRFCLAVRRGLRLLLRPLSLVCLTQLALITVLIAHLGFGWLDNIF